MKNLQSLIGLSVAFSLVTFTHALAVTPQSTPSTKVPKPECRLQVDNAHISSTLMNHRNVKAVKVNVYSICKHLQTQVIITLKIYKTQEPADRYYGPFVNSQLGGRNSGLTVEMQDKFVICKNSIPTEWFGVACAKAFIEGNGSTQAKPDLQKRKSLNAALELPCIGETKEKPINPECLNFCAG